MDKVSDTPRFGFAIRAAIERECDDAENPKGMSAHEGKTRISANHVRYMLALIDAKSAELAAQKEQFRVLEEEMLVLGDERNAAVLDAKENMEIANEFKKLMEQYRQREAEANKALRVAAGLLSTMPQFSNMHLDDVLEKILEETREKK